MNILINPYLIARFKAVQAAFMQPGFRIPAMALAQPNNWSDLLDEDDKGDGGDKGSGGTGSTIRDNSGNNFERAKTANSWKDLLGEDDKGDGGDEGGGGTIRGNRGKNAEHAKAAMRKLTRGGR